MEKWGPSKCVKRLPGGLNNVSWWHLSWIDAKNHQKHPKKSKSLTLLCNLPPTFHKAHSNRYTPKISGVPQKMTWCQHFGVQDIQKLSKKIGSLWVSFGRNSISPNWPNWPQKNGVFYAKKYTSLKKVHYCRAGSGGSDYYELRKKKWTKLSILHNWSGWYWQEE